MMINETHYQMVLIHGGTFSGSCWHLVLPYLTRRALAVDLPGRGSHPADLTRVTSRAWAESVISDLDSAGIDKAVMVGHSLGGLTLNALTLHFPERVAGLAFIACPFPEEGGCIGEACTEEVWLGMQAARLAGQKVIDDGREEYASRIFGNDMDLGTFNRVLADKVPESLDVFFEPLELGGLRGDIPILYVKLLKDQASPPEIQEAAIKAIQPNEVRELESGHMAMYSQPQKLASILNRWVCDLESRL